MVGSHLLQLCLNANNIIDVLSLVRRHSDLKHQKLQEILISDFTDYSKIASAFQNIDLVFFCIGVYTGAVSKKEFTKVTVDYPVALAKAVHAVSPEAKFCLLSGSGADRTEKSSMLFARDKGAAENQLAAIGFKAFHTFRPAYIYPVIPRKEPNIAYSISRTLYPLIKLLGPNASIKSTELAQGMLNVAMKDHDQEVFENKDILKHLMES